MERFPILLAVTSILLPSCSGLHSARSFRVLPNSPDYVLQSPDTRETPFPDILRTYNGFERGQGSTDLRPLMEIRIENAYYQKGASRRGLTGFLGTEIASYEVRPQGLRLLSLQPMKERPEDETPVQGLIPTSQTRFHHYRFYFEIFFRQNSNSHGSVLLGADSSAELDQLSSQLSRPEDVCYEHSPHCAVFPEACSVSVEMKITVNGKPQIAGWGSVLASIADHPRYLQMKRLYAGRLTPIRINLQDLNILRLPLLPGDEIHWN